MFPYSGLKQKQKAKTNHNKQGADSLLSHVELSWDKWPFVLSSLSHSTLLLQVMTG